MKLDLESVARAPGARWTHEFTVSLPKDDELDLVEPVRGKITITNTGRLLLAQGEMTARIRLECARCAEPFVASVSVPIQEEFSIRSPEGGPVEPADTIDQEEPAESAFADNILDLGEVVRQHVLVAAPLTPLCAPDCKGLCPECGNNLNEGTCGCAEAAGESPFSVLESLLGTPNDKDEPSR